MGPSPLQILIIIGIALLLFGAGRIADVGKGLGEGIRNFKKGLREDEKDGDSKKKLAEAKDDDDEDDDDEKDKDA
ncbi:MAG: twin-arginine translocase TatA/TatE family subunit [Deltaproteobacteria bacterium]|jgi:sec-independent protein translocase protein TatA|nr:twin-arginine translocase TatA/TatE family subunit [Deltaproteobacteria bacterium]MBW2536404.1 twin-arginine translocase TatA/TatE family subunit [Deltaproteobacteria bacterium]